MPRSSEHARSGEENKSPGRDPNMGDHGGPPRSLWTGQIGLITRRSQVQILPPPPRKVQVRAGAQAPALLRARLASHLILVSLALSHDNDAHMRGSKRELRPGVWELRVALGYDPDIEKHHQVSKTVHGGASASRRFPSGPRGPSGSWPHRRHGRHGRPAP